MSRVTARRLWLTWRRAILQPHCWLWSYSPIWRICFQCSTWPTCRTLSAKLPQANHSDCVSGKFWSLHGKILTHLFWTCWMMVCGWAWTTLLTHHQRGQPANLQCRRINLYLNVRLPGKVLSIIIHWLRNWLLQRSKMASLLTSLVALRLSGCSMTRWLWASLVWWLLRAASCLVVDSSVSNVAANTWLCFHVGDRLYQCLCLKFGARARGWYWGRGAGLVVRTAHALLDHHHALWQYVEDLLAWIDKQTAPLWAPSLIILFLILGILMSWRKAFLDSCLAWIGWNICLDTWTVQILDAKISMIIAQIDTLMRKSKVSLRDLQSTLGLLLWLTGALHHLRPLLIPLCRALSNFPTAMVGVSPVLFRQIIDMVDENFYLTESLRSHHHSLVGTCHSCGQHVRFRLQHLDHRSHQVQTGVVRHYRPWVSTPHSGRWSACCSSSLEWGSHVFFILHFNASTSTSASARYSRCNGDCRNCWILWSCLLQWFFLCVVSISHWVGRS